LGFKRKEEKGGPFSGPFFPYQNYWGKGRRKLVIGSIRSLRIRRNTQTKGAKIFGVGQKDPKLRALPIIKAFPNSLNQGLPKGIKKTLIGKELTLIIA